MTDRQKVIGLLKQCLEDWPYAATRVPTIMHRIQEAISLLKAQEEEIKQLKTMNISASDNAFACGVIHGGVTINQKASEITNIKHVDVFNG